MIRESEIYELNNSPAPMGIDVADEETSKESQGAEGVSFPYAPPSEEERKEKRMQDLVSTMARFQVARARYRDALQHVRDLHLKLTEADGQSAQKVRQQYQKAVAELSQAKNEFNLIRAELHQLLRRW